jgi:hypothetical protein
LTASFREETAIYEIDDSSVFCEIVRRASPA